jgi:NAD(P)-dependent dehydrogenase (short-subunit alcohol dehydrogenase family)
MKCLEGKVAIVTGAGRGIGRGIAIAYAREGANVVVASRTQSSIDETVSAIRADGGSALGIACDVGRRDDVFAAVAKTVAAFGTVDILVNNAQGFGTEQRPAGTPRLTPLEDFDEEEWEYTFRTGTLATLWGMKAVFPSMKDRGGKRSSSGSRASGSGALTTVPLAGASTSSRPPRTLVCGGRLGVAADVHREIVDARLARRVGEGVTAVAGVIDAVARAQRMGHAVEREPQRAPLDGDVLARARRVRIEFARVDAAADGGAHQLELDSWQYPARFEPGAGGFTTRRADYDFFGFAGCNSRRGDLRWKARPNVGCEQPIRCHRVCKIRLSRRPHRAATPRACP